MYYFKKFSRHFSYNSIILCDNYYFSLLIIFSMFNIVSIIIFGLIVFFMNTSLPFLYFLLYIFQCAFKHLHTYCMVFVWWAQMESASRVLKTIHPNCFCFALLSTSFSISFMFYLIKNINIIEFDLTFGGLKWNRTIDLTLIRRAL